MAYFGNMRGTSHPTYQVGLGAGSFTINVSGVDFNAYDPVTFAIKGMAAATPSTADNSQKVATTAWVNLQPYAANVGTSGLVWAGPVSSGGAPTFRGLVWSDLSAGGALPVTSGGTGPDFISGMTVTATAATTVTIGEGYCRLSNGSMAYYAGGTLTASGVSAGSAHHVYYDDLTGTVTINTSAPTTVFYAKARTRNFGAGVNARYLGSVYGKAASSLHLTMAVAKGNAVDVTYLQNTGTDNILISGGGATTAASLSAATMLYGAATATANIRVVNNGVAGGGLVRIYGPGTTILLTNVPAANVMTMNIPLSAIGQMGYDVVGAATATINVLGYTYER